jgi:hypothetical protein
VDKTEELSRIERIIKDSEIRLCAIKSNLDLFEKEIELLETLEAEFYENLKVLKRKKIVAVASEYKKIKQNLNKAKQRLMEIKAQKDQNIRAHKEMVDYLNKYKELFEKLELEGKNNVLYPKFGKKDG